MKKITLLFMAVMVAVLASAQQPLMKSARVLTHPAKQPAKTMAKPGETPRKAAARRAASDYVVITDTPEGEMKTYKRAGYYYEEDEDGYVDVANQSGKMTVVFNGNEVYFKDIVAGFAAGSWVKGTLSADGKTVTVPLKQNLYYEGTQYDACLMIAVGNLSGDDYEIDNTVTEITYTLDGDKLTLNGTSQDHILGVFWTDDFSWQGYGEWNTVLTEYVIDRTLVTPPAGLVTTDMPLSGRDYEGTEVSGTVKVGIDGSDIYFQGLIADLPDVWLKGTLQDGTVSIPITYVFTTDESDVFAAGFANSALAPIELIYDSEAGTYELDGYLLLNDNGDTFSYYETLLGYYTGLFLGERPATLVVPEGLTTEAMPFAGMDYWYEEAVEGTVNVGFDGNDVYIQGLLPDVAEGWIKGTFNEDKTTVTFPIQYVGVDDELGCSVYLMGTNDEGDEAPADVVFAYDEATNMFTSQGYIWSSSRKDMIYFNTSYEPGLVIGTVADAMWVAAEQGYANTDDITSITIDHGVTTGQLSAGTNESLTPKYYNSGTSVRLYPGNTLTITSSKVMAKIEFAMTGNEKQMSLTADQGDYTFAANKGTWTGEAEEVTFTVPNESGRQARIQSITVYYLNYEKTMVEVPSTMTTETYHFIGTDTYYNEEDRHDVLVGFVGNEVYFQGLSALMEDAWVKGKLVDGKVTIPNWSLGTWDSILGSHKIVFSGAEMTYDAEADEFTCAEYKTYADGYAMDEYADVLITKREVADGIQTVQATTDTTNAPLYNIQGMRVKVPTQKGIYIRDGRKVVVK